MPHHFAAVMLFALAVVTAGGAAIAAPGTTPADQVISAARLAAVADRVAYATVADRDRPVAPAFQLYDQHVPAGVVSIAAETPSVNPSYVAVPLQISVDGRLVRSLIAGYRVQQFVRTIVAAHDLASGAILAPDDVAVARVLSTGRPAVGADAVVGRKLRTATARGSLIFPEQTSVNEIVKVGQGAVLIINDGPVALMADVVVRSSGGLGDTVTVYNPSTNRIISGTVTGPNRVELDLPTGATE